MPLRFNTSDEARKLILDESKKWRTVLEKARGAKDGLKDVANTVIASNDVLVSAQAFTLDKLEHISQGQEALGMGLDKTQKAVDMLSNEHLAIKEAVNKNEKKIDNSDKEAERLAQRAKAAQNAIHRLQLERSQTVLVVRNLGPLVAGKETYADLETLVARLLKELHVNREGIRVNTIKRLQRSKHDKSGDYPALRIELGGIGDKIKMYHAIDTMIKSGKKVSYQLTNEIPEYAIKAYKNQCRIATIIRKIDRDIKTRVSIERGDLWPTITTKKRGTPRYGPVDETLYQRAKEELNKEKRLDNERRRKEREEKLLAGDEEMDIGRPGVTIAQLILYQTIWLLGSFSLIIPVIVILTFTARSGYFPIYNKIYPGTPETKNYPAPGINTNIM